MRRTRTEWEEVITKMIEKGATGTEKEFETVYGYVLRNFGKLYINAARPDEIVMILGLSEKETPGPRRVPQGERPVRGFRRGQESARHRSQETGRAQRRHRVLASGDAVGSRLANGRLSHMLIARYSREGVDVMHAHARLIAGVVIAAAAMTGLGLAQGAPPPATATRRTEPSADASAPPAGRGADPGQRGGGGAGQAGAPAAAAAASRSSLARSRRPMCWSAASRCTRPTAPAATRWTCAEPPTARIRTCCARARRSTDKQGELIGAAIAKHTPADHADRDRFGRRRRIHPQRPRHDGRAGQPARTQSDERRVERPRWRCRRRARPTSRPPARRVTR